MDLFSAFVEESTPIPKAHEVDLPDKSLKIAKKRPADDEPKVNGNKQFKEDNKINDYLNSRLKDLPVIEHDKFDVSGATHEVVYHQSMGKPELQDPTTEPAKNYKFTLDPFQKRGVLCLENKQSVLISAHTSAGKTVIAEYAIAIRKIKNKKKL